jgi:hypothetical protein
MSVLVLKAKKYETAENNAVTKEKNTKKYPKSLKNVALKSIGFLSSANIGNREMTKHNKKVFFVSFYTKLSERPRFQVI